MENMRQPGTACLYFPGNFARIAAARRSGSPPFSYCQPPLSHNTHVDQGEGARLPRIPRSGSPSVAMNGAKKNAFQSIAFRPPPPGCRLVTVPGSWVRMKRSVTSNSTSASTCCIWVSMCRRSSPTSRTCCTDVQDLNSHSRASPGNPGLLCPLILSVPALSPQKQSSGSQEPHIRTWKLPVESGWSISTRVT